MRGLGKTQIEFHKIIRQAGKRQTMTTSEEMLLKLLDDTVECQGFCGTIQQVVRDHYHNFLELESWANMCTGKIGDIVKCLGSHLNKINNLIERTNFLYNNLNDLSQQMKNLESRISNVQNFLVKTFNNTH